MTEFPLVDSGLAIPMFNQGDDLIACLNKAMAFLTAVASSRFPSTNNQLRTSSNPRNQATIQDGRVTVQQVQGRQGQSYSGTSYKGHMARQCTQPKRPRNTAWFKDKAMLAEAQEAGQILDEEQLAFLADPEIPDGQAVQTIIPKIDAFQTEDLDAYDSDCDDVPHSDSYHNDMDNQSVHAMQDFEQTPVVDFSNNKIHKKLALKEQVDSLEQNLSKQIKDKESLLQTFTVFKNESKEKENKYLENEIDLEKKIKELDNIVYQVGQSAQTVHIVLSSKHVAMLVIDDDETLILEELNKLSEDFGKHFVPQQELSAEQAFWFHMSNPTTVSSDASPVKVEVPSELPKVSLVNESLKNLKFHLAKFDSVVKKRTTPDALTEEYFKNNDLKAQLQDKDTTICKLKEIIKYVRENNKEEKVNHDRSELETINVELENRKEIVDNAAQISNATAIVSGMFKLDLVPLALRLLQNRKAHIDYLKYTQEQADILWGIVEQAKAK
ncbi:hypothetical protein Tco_1315978 [Tanacetum coccineum]